MAWMSRRILCLQNLLADLWLMRRHAGAHGADGVPGTKWPFRRAQEAVAAGAGGAPVPTAAGAVAGGPVAGEPVAGGAPASRVSNSRTAPSLANGSLLVPHF